MRRKLQASVVLGLLVLANPVVAQEGMDEPTPEEPSAGTDTEPAPPPPESESAPDESESMAASSEPATAETDEGVPEARAPDMPVGPEVAPEDETTGARGSAAPGAVDKPVAWETFVTGYFRAPMAIGFSPRRGPDDPDGDAKMQYSYGPNRTIDANYYSFAYTRLQEQDWAEVFIGAKKKHVEAAVGMMGYWYQAASFRNNDAAWSPGLAYLKLDSDVEMGGIEPNVALTAGAFWPKFGTFDKYDTYTLGRFHHVGEQLRFAVPVSSDFGVTLVQGFGGPRDGLYNSVSPPPYQAKVGLMLLHYENLQFTYKDYLDVGLHYNKQWTRDPHLFQSPTPGKNYTAAREAYVQTIGGEATLRAPIAGSLWVSPSMIQVEHGWALANAGIEAMHSVGGEGLATNYLGWSGSLPDSDGSGKLINVGFLYENTLSNLLGEPGGKAPELTLNVFGLFTDITLDLPETSKITQDHIGQFKYGADVEYQAFDWLGFMLRWDEVNYNLSHGGYVFSAITPRVTFSSHFMSGESIYLQYSRYRYGDEMVIAGQWPWGTQLVAGSNITQGGPYGGEKPDMDVVKLQAEVSF